MKTPYEVLGVPRSADDDTIRAALRRAAKAYHPDVNAGDPTGEQRLKEALAAYELLTDPSKRTVYDRRLHDRRQRNGRRLLATGLASAGVASGATLALTLWLARPHHASAPILDGALVAVEPPGSANRKVPAFAADGANELADGEAAGTAPASSTAIEWEQIAQGSDLPQISAFVLRNPDAPEAESARSSLMLAIGATEDVALLNALRAADGAVAERARQRLDHLNAVAAIPEHAPAAVVADDPGPEATAGALDARSRLERGQERLRRADFDGAIAEFDAAVELEPGNALAYRLRAGAWDRKGDRERALADFALAIRSDPHDPAIFRERGLLWRRAGAVDLALMDFDQAIRLGFSDARAYYERGLVWQEKGHNGRAIADFTRAIKIDPLLAAAYTNRGAALRDTGDLAGSAADLEQATRIEATQSSSGDDLTQRGD